MAPVESMPRSAQFVPIKTPKGWMVSIPPALSDSGTRQRRFFDKKAEAEGFGEKLKIRTKHHGIYSKVLTPSEEDQAAITLKLLSDAGIKTSLVEIVGQHIASIEKSKASVPFLQAFNAFVKSKKRRPAYQLALKALGKITGPLHQKLVRDVTPSDLEEILAGMGPAHRNQRMRELRAVFNYGLKKGWTDENPILAMDFVHRQVAEPEVYEPSELARLLATADRTEHRLIPLLCLGAFGGIRQHEILRLHWRNIDLTERSIDMSGEQTKKGRRRSVEINETLLAWLQWYLGKYGLQSGPVSAWSGIWSVRIPTRKLHKEAGVQLKPNALRHSFASYFLAEHGDIDALVLALGHRGSPTVLWEHYHRAVKKSAAKAFWAITPVAVVTDEKIVAIA
jgi:integrase/recombinase XerD